MSHTEENLCNVSIQEDPKWSDPSPDLAQVGVTWTRLPFFFSIQEDIWRSRHVLNLDVKGYFH
jgi:hypothetical protein